MLYGNYSPLASMNSEQYCDGIRKRLFEAQMEQADAVGSSAENSPAFQRKIEALQKRLAECSSPQPAQQPSGVGALGGLAK